LFAHSAAAAAHGALTFALAGTVTDTYAVTVEHTHAALPVETHWVQIPPLAAPPFPDAAGVRWVL
jgi:hypothetical protein